MRKTVDKNGFPVLIIFDPVPLFEVPVVGGIFKIGARIDITSLIHLIIGFLMAPLGIWIVLAFSLGGERSDGTNSDQGADPLDAAFSLLGFYLFGLL